MTTQLTGPDLSPDEIVRTVADCWFLSGPTASGKTRIGIELARLLDGEIISLDSMAVYRGMDIGTAKPSVSQRAEVAHHLIDIVDPNQLFSLSDYVRAACQKVCEIRGRNREVLFVGGTPLYLKALLRGIFAGPAADSQLRQRLIEHAAQSGSAALHRRLQVVDPRSAARLHPHDLRRIIRAIEVYYLTGQPISHLQQQFASGPAADQRKVFVLKLARNDLYRRIDQRVDQMMAGGLVKEVQQLLARHGSLSKTALQAVGYAEVIRYLEGLVTLQETVEQIKRRTRQFARRQQTWFRSLPECQMVPADPDQSPHDIAQRIITMAERE